MTTSKFIASFFVVILHISANCQDTAREKRLAEYNRLVLGKYTYQFNNSNHKEYFEKAKSLLELDNYDSSLKATKLLWGLNFYDSFQYSIKFLQPMLNKIEKSNLSYLQTILQGKWRFSHDFNTGLVASVTTSKRRDTLKVIEFTNTEILIRKKNKLVRKVKYLVSSDSALTDFLKVINFRIHFQDTKKEWGFTVDNKYLNIFIDPDCSCGCRHQIYLRQLDRKLLAVK